MMNRIRNILEMLNNVKALCIGDIMLDKYTYGNSERISPEAPVMIVGYKNEISMLGGVGNVFRNLISLSSNKHILLSVVGEDTDKDILEQFLQETGAEYVLVTEKERITTVKTRLIVDHQQIVRLDKETVSPITEATRKELLNEIQKRIAGVDVVILSDYGKGIFPKQFIQKIIRLGKEAHKPVFVDPKGKDFGKYKDASYVKPNLLELQGFFDNEKFIKGEDKFPAQIEIADAVKTLMGKYNVENVIVTLGKNGMLYVGGRGEIIRDIPEHINEVYDVSGAGDTVMAVLALLLGAGVEIKNAMHIANLAARIVIAKFGTATVSRIEILSEYLQETSIHNPLHKIIDLPQAKQIVRNWQTANNTIVFTNGCFDLLHYGHISSLRQAKEHGDKLIVAVNSDYSIKKIKGPGRPIQDEKTRLAAIASLTYVDMVILFDDETALRPVEELRPDIIAKEGYVLEDWPEALLVKEYGGKVVCLKREEGYSTTTIVKTMSAMAVPG